MVDNDESDDKIVGVLQNDSFWQHVTDIDELPSALIERLRHYFATYKLQPGEKDPVIVKETYDRAYALKVIEASILDYDESFGRVD
jgi:inorganic pyrophosphatase